ncbi:hypothetical protein GCM10007971_24500 [Oceanobacillus indicireducens]|uniref:Uncharacterized protein n=1 Tax=Oceanobacillus indicireducens TaxID=1004261 RepID=A0A917XZ16_9BACI|nr:hypothetical protein GCM10007971_24500 [Oceanobacillus indicireducens]
MLPQDVASPEYLSYQQYLYFYSTLAIKNKAGTRSPTSFFHIEFKLIL